MSLARSELLIGDDVVSGSPFNFDTRPTLVVQAGTTNIEGGLFVRNSTVDAVLVSTHPPFADPPDLRAYDAMGGRLLSLHVDAGRAVLNQVDVPSALAGTPTTTVLTLMGDIPIAPVAMVWNGIDKRLYIVDDVAVGPKHALRLLRVWATGDVEEQWRTRCVKNLPVVHLSASSENEVVLSIVSDDRSEFALLDGNGMPLESKTLKGRLLAAAIATQAGVSMPLARRPGGEHSNLSVRLVRRAESERGICGAEWLRGHVGDMTSDRLRTSRKTCHDDRHDGGGDD